MKKITSNHILIIFWVLGLLCFLLSYFLSTETIDNIFGSLFGIFFALLFVKIESLEEELKKKNQL